MSTTIPTITQDFLRDRGFPVDIVICPNCLAKWEVLRNDRQPPRCHLCQTTRPPVDYLTFAKMQQIAELDLMPAFVLIAYLKQAVLPVLWERKQTEYAGFIDGRISLLEKAFGRQPNPEFISPVGLPMQ